MLCPRCGNTDPSLFYKKNGKFYCRACVKFKGKKANISKTIKPKIVASTLGYKLSEEQEKVSNFTKDFKEDIYINAVCGSGKTEMVFASIEKALSRGERVGFVIPRREVVKEIYERLKDVYPKLQVTAVYGGHNEYLDGDIIVLTAHQCYRYPRKFGLLILDEYDAFPLKGDEVLLRLIQRACYGKMIYLSATFSAEELMGNVSLTVRRRYHHYDLPVPIIKTGNRVTLFIKLLSFIIKNHRYPIFIFAPTIKEGKRLWRWLFLFTPSLFTSLTENKDELFRKIKDGSRRLVVSTTILERGITVKNLQVGVFLANHPTFDYRTLVQIEGRVGRKKDAPKGEIIFFATKINDDIEKACKEIVDKNNRLSY